MPSRSNTKMAGSREIAYFKIGDSSDLGPADVPSGTEVGGFSDVQQSDYFADAVLWAVDRGITNGTSSTTFSPGATCTRGADPTFLWRAMGSPEPTEANPFLDVSQDAYYAKAACWAKEEGLFVSPAGSYVFLGETPCTRSETVLYLWRLAGSPATAASSAFQDVDHNAEYAQAVAWAVEQGITQGTSATAFSPDMTCTRGQIWHSSTGIWPDGGLGHHPVYPDEDGSLFQKRPIFHLLAAHSFQVLFFIR